MTSLQKTEVRLRYARLEDGRQLAKFLTHQGLIMPTKDRDIDNHWRRLWVENPAILYKEGNSALGWVLEHKHNIVGFFCNLPRLYYFRNKQIIISVASQWALEKKHRRKIHQLASAYFEQKNTDMLIATTANNSAGRIFKYYGAQKIPQLDYEKILYWVVRPDKFIHAGMVKKKFPQFFNSVISKMGFPVKRAIDTFKFHKPKGQKNGVTIIDVKDIDEQFDDLWVRKSSNYSGLLACRDSINLRWHFMNLTAEKKVNLLLSNKGRLRGYGIVLGNKTQDMKLRRLQIVDLFVENDDEMIVNDLLCAAYDFAVEKKYDILEWKGMPSQLRKIALQHWPLRRNILQWPLYYKIKSNEFLSKTISPNNWYVTPFDGDTTIV